MKSNNILAMLFTLLLVGEYQPAAAQSPQKDSTECACQETLPLPANQPPELLHDLLHDSRHVTDSAGKPTGLSLAFYRTVLQAPAPQAFLFTLHAFYHIPWPGRALLVNTLKKRFPQHACTSLLLRYLQ
jgi:hypothetical protein